MALHSVRVQRVVVTIVVIYLASAVEGAVLLSHLKPLILVDAFVQGQSPGLSPAYATVGDDYLVIKWVLNGTYTGSGVDERYAGVKLKLCFAPVSQTDRGWRTTKDDLHRDKTCTNKIATQKYTTEGNTTVWRIRKNIPGASYFVRAYVVNTEGIIVTYGQTTDPSKTMNLIVIKPISGKHMSIDIASALLSIFSIGSLLAILATEFSRASAKN